MSDMVVATLVGAALGIFGTGLGSALTWYATWYTEQQRWAREDRSRFHQQRFGIYSEFGDLSGRVIALLRNPRLPSSDDPSAADTFERELALRLLEWSGVRHRVTMLGSIDLVRTAADIGDLIKSAAQEPRIGHEELVARGQELVGRFSQIAREELAVPMSTR